MNQAICSITLLLFLCKTYAAFVDDTGIKDPKIRAFGPVVSVNRGPIHVYDVRIVG